MAALVEIKTGVGSLRSSGQETQMPVVEVRPHLPPRLEGQSRQAAAAQERAPARASARDPGSARLAG